MRVEEQASLESLRSTVEAGFREIRDLMEKRRDQELEDHTEFRDEISTIKAEIQTQLAVRTTADILWGRIWKLLAFIVTTAVGSAAVVVVVTH